MKHPGEAGKPSLYGLISPQREKTPKQALRDFTSQPSSFPEHPETCTAMVQFLDVIAEGQTPHTEEDRLPLFKPKDSGASGVFPLPVPGDEGSCQL